MTEGTWFDDSELDERFPAWTRGNAADVFPEPFSPLGHSLVLAAMAAGLRDAYIAIGALDYDEFVNPERPDLFKMFGGYPYNPLTMTRILGARMPGATPEMIDRAFFDERDEVPPYERHDWHDSAKHEAKLGESMAWAMSTDALPNLDADKALAHRLRQDRPDLAALTDSALHARARAMLPYIQQTFENAMIVSSLSALGTGALGAVCEGLGDASMAIRLLAGIEVDSSAPSHVMWDLSRVAQKSSVLTAAFDGGADETLARLRTSTDPEAASFVARLDQFLFDHGSRAQTNTTRGHRRGKLSRESRCWRLTSCGGRTILFRLPRVQRSQSSNAIASPLMFASASLAIRKQPASSKLHCNRLGSSWPAGSARKRTLSE